ncbi:MAG: peptide deformylase [Acidimicrobiales bacterium]
MSYRLRYWGDPVLTERANEVVDIDASVAALAEAMVETMREADGLGLAAPQVGVQKRLFVYHDGEGGPVHTIVNPAIAETDGEWELDEGCLSIPDLYFPIVRPKRVHLTGWDLEGREVSIEADEVEARCFQHELDHLDGILLLSRLDDGQRKQAMRALRRRAPITAAGDGPGTPPGR